MPVFDIVDGELSLPEEPKPAKTKKSRGSDDGRYDELFAKADADNNLPPGMTKAIANAETGFLGDWDRRLKAVSPAGAHGPVQFMPATGRRFGLNSIEDMRNPEKAIPAAGRYLAEIRNFLGNDDPRIMAAAYNAGEHNKAVRAGRVPNNGETNKYVPRVMEGISRFGRGMESVRLNRQSMPEEESTDSLFSLDGVQPVEQPTQQQAVTAQPEQQPQEQTPAWSDYAKQYAGGVAGIPEALAAGADMAGFDGAAKYLREGASAYRKDWRDQMTPAGVKAAETPLLDDQGNLQNWRAIPMAAAESAAGTIAMGGVGRAVAAPLQFFNSAKKIAPILSGAGLSPKVAEKVAEWTINGVAYGGAEGVYSGLQNAEQARNEVLNTKLGDLRQNPLFNELLAQEPKSGSGLERGNRVREKMADMAMRDVFQKTAISTGLIGAATGGGIFGQLESKLADGVAKRIVKGAVSEGLVQEGPQSFGESVIGNQAQQQFGDPSRGTFEGTLNDTLTGIGAGMMTGGPLGVFTGKQDQRQIGAEDLSDSVNKRMRELDAKEEKSPKEQAEYDFLKANINDPQALATQYGYELIDTAAQRDKKPNTTISSTGIPGDTNAQSTDGLSTQNEGREGDPLSAQTARQGGEGGISPQTYDATQGPQVTDAQQITQASQIDGGLQPRGQVQGMPTGEGVQGIQSGGQEVRNPQAQEIAPEIRPASDGSFQIVDTNTGTVISQHPTDVDAFEALDQLNADREIPTPTLEATNEGQIQEANPPGQEGLLSSPSILPAGGQINTGTITGEANATDTQGSAGTQAGGTAAGSPGIAGGEQQPAVDAGNAGGTGIGGQLDGASQQSTATQGELGGQPDDARTLGPVLQNRNRSNPASVQQMQSIAGNPDYLRLSPSRNFAEGAPVVAGGTIPDQQMGRQETTVTAKGRRIPVRYAVVEAGSVLASNRADGTVNSDYGNAEVIAPRAIAGNGRIAGLQKAYSQGSAQQYRADLESDDLHGIDQAVIRGMRSPVLVRVMPESELTQDIGDESNIAGGLSLSPVEQARNDATRLDIDGLSFDDGGDISRQSVVQFVRSMPESEQGGLLDQDGTPNRQAYDRLSAAVFHKAYDSDELVRLHTQAADPDSRLVMSSLAKLAPKFSRLKDKGAFDIRGWMTDAAKAIVNGRRRGLTLEQIANQQDLDIDPRAYDIVRLFADNPRSNKAVIEDLSDFSDFAYNEATRDTQDMFGETPRATESDLRKRLENYRERRRQEALAKRGGGKPVPQRAQKTAADPAGPDNPAQTATDQQDLLPAATDADRAESGRQALAEAQKEQQRKSNATQAPAADDGLFAQDNRQDELRFSLRPDEQQQRINRLNRGIDAQNRRYAGGDQSNARSRVELAAPQDVPAARRVEWKLASAIAAVFKHNLIPVRGEAGGQLNFDGVVDPNGDPSTIFIDVDSVSPISRVMAHELLHGLKLNAPKIYDNLLKTLRQLYDADALVAYVNGRGYSGKLTEANEEEWIADFVSNVIHSPDALVKVAFAMNRNKTGSGLNFLRRVQGLVERIKQGLAGTPLGANRVISKSDLQKAEDAVIEALAQYAAHQEKGTKPSGPLKFSNRTKEKTERIAEADYRVLRRDDNNLLPVEQKVFDDFLAGRPDGKELLQRLQEHRGTPWAQQAIEGIFVRQAIKEYAAGRTPEFQSSFDSKAVTKARALVSRMGEEGIFAYLEENRFVGDAAKPINNISSSFINCNPSKDCAKYCYATKGHYKFAPAVVKSEMVTMAIEMDPARVAQRAAAEYKATAEFANNKALRIFDKGDGNQAWIPFIRQMNVRGVRIHVFSKVPDFLRQVPDMNLKLLSVDNSNMEMADQNPDLPVAFVYSGGINQVDMLAKLAARGQIQVVLPVKLGQKLLDKQQVTMLKQTVKGIGKYLCPIDAGVKAIGPNSDRTKWNCTKCDINGGLGCYHGKVTVAVLNSHEAKPKSGPEIAREILEVRAEIARFTAAGKSGNGGAGGPVADIRRDDATGVQALLSKVDRLMGQLLEQYEPDAETRDALQRDGATDSDGAGIEAQPGDSGRADLKFSNRQKADDKAYLDAVNAGDMETAQRMVDAAAVKAGYFTAADYRMAHRAPNSQDDVSLDKVKDSGMVPDDYWTHPQWYQTQPEERESFYKVTDALRTAKQRMWVYRAVPKNVKDGAIRNGDWVTPSREYARIEGQSIPEGYRLIAQRVSLKDLYWDGNSIAELGFDDGKAYAYANTKNNRKLMDVVTRDDDGNIIPLSKRFNKRSDDLRFSNRPTQLVEEPLQDDLFRQQLDFYLDADPAGQPGPKTQAAKQSAVSAVEVLRGSAGGILGTRLADTYAARQRISLVGHTLTSRTDLATLAQVYRDPRFETFRLFFVNQEGKIVSQVGLSSRLPASSAVFVGPDNQKFLDDLTKAAEKAGATGYYMLHNHPSTNPLPSNQDVGLTMFFDQKMNLINYGHVVLDTNEFGIIKPSGDIKVIQKDFGQVSPYAANEFGATTISSPTDLIETAKKLEVDKDAVTMIVTTAQHKVLGITTIPSESIRNSSRSLRNMRIRKALKAMNGAKAFAVGTDRKTLLPLGNMVMDAIHIKEDGTYASIQAELGGAFGMSDPFVVMGRNVPRVTADSSPEFDYLRDQTLLARGGGMSSSMTVSEPDTDLRFSNKRQIAQKEYEGVVARYKGTDQWLKAPNGKPTNLTERQWVQVRTNSFKAWFGDWEQFANGTDGNGVWADDAKLVSKVVDENGEPLVVYHGAKQGGFTILDPDKGDGHRSPMIFTAATRTTSASYSGSGSEIDMPEAFEPTDPAGYEKLGYEFDEDEDGRITVINPDGSEVTVRSWEKALAEAKADLEFQGYPEAEEQRGIYSLFLNIRNPYEENFEGANWDGDRSGQYIVVDEEGNQASGYFNDEYDAQREAELIGEGATVEPAQDHWDTTNTVAEAAKRFGSDGAIIRQVVDDGGQRGIDWVTADDVFVIFDAKQAKSATQNTGEFGPSMDLRFSNKRNPTFYSQLARGFESSKMNSMPGSQWRAWLFSNKAKLGIKDDEIAWTGIEDFLTLNAKEKLTKAEIASYLADNGVQVQDVMKGEPRSRPKITARRAGEMQDDGTAPSWAANVDRNMWVVLRSGEPIFTAEGDYTEREAIGNYSFDEDDDLIGDEPDTKFSNYTIPGGTNYRELLITLPKVEPVTAEDIDRAEKRLTALQELSEEFAAEGNQERAQSFAEKATAAQQALDSLVNRKKSQRLTSNYASGHWDEKNVLAHLRFDERTDADGNRVMFIIEIQSDWGQGFKKYKDQNTDDLETALRQVDKNPVPKAPFVTDTKAWVSLALKRAIRHAAENGFDKIAFADGKQNEQLYWGNDVVAPAVDRWNEVTKPLSVRELGENIFGREMYAAMPLKHVDSGVLPMLKHDQVRQSVISRIPVDVMDIFSSNGINAKKLFSDGYMVFDRLAGSDRRRAATAIGAAISQTATTIRAKLRSLESGRTDFEILPALSASDLGPREIVGILDPERVFHGGTGLGSEKSATARSIAKSAPLEDGGRLEGKLGSAELAKLLNTHAELKYGRDGLLQHSVEPGPGQGMRAFYDQIVPSVANDALKKLGGTRVGTVTMSTGKTPLISARGAQGYYVEVNGEGRYFKTRDEARAWADANMGGTQPGFPITPALQDKALSGMPLFSNKRNVMGQPALATWTMPDDSKLERWTYLLQDKHIDTKRVVERLKTRVADAWDPYLKETLYHGRAAKDVDDFKVGEVRPLLQAMSTRGITIGDLETFLWNRHAPEANAQIARINPAYPDGGSGIKTQDALGYLANLPAGKRTDLEALAAQIDAITAGTRRLLVESGLETQDTIDAWEATYSDYIPLQRETDDLAQKGIGTGQGFSTRGSASKRRTGSGRAVEDILANVMMQRERAITRAEKNKVGLALYGLAIQNPNPEFWYPVNPDAVKSPAKVAQELVNMGMLDSDLAGIIQEPTVAQINPRTGLVEYKINPLLRNRDNVLAVRIKGKDRFLFFSTENERAIRMAQSLKNLDAPEMHGLMNAFRMVTRYISSINTQYNPIFGAVNLIRDTGAGLLNLSTTPLAGKQAEVMSHIMPALTGIYGDLRADRKGKPRKVSQWSQLWEEFQTVGGKTGYRDMYATAEDRAKALESELKKIQDGTVKRLTRGLFDWLSDYNETLENAVRLSAYKAGVDSGMTKERAAVMAKELTVNFNRKGQVASQAGSLYAFFNAAVQGTARLAETVKGPAGKKIVAGGLLMGVIQAVLMAAAGYDDDEPPEFVRERNFIIPLPNGKYVNIPLPLGFHVIPNTSRVMVEAFMNPDDAGKKIAGLLGSYFEAFNPIGSAGWSAQTIAPTFADPLAALSENRDSFGKEIAKKDRTQTNPTPGFTRTKDTASWLSKNLAWGINRLTGGTDYVQGALSPTPDQLDFLFGQATGGVGREVMKIEQAASSWMSGEELPPYKYPLGVGRFVGDTKSQSADANRFYANITKLNELENEIKGRAKDGKDVAGFLRSNPLATLVPAGNQTERAVTELRSRKRKLVEQKAPKATIKALEGQIAAQMKALNDRVRSVSRPPRG